MLFSAINAVAKSFLTENNKRVLYYYTLVSPESVIVSKILVNILILVSMAVVGIFIYTIVMGNPIQDLGFYIVILISGAMSLAIGVTLVSAIAAQGSNNTSLMAILSFPILLPILLYTIKLSKAALDGLDRTLSMDELLILWAFNVIAAVLSYILYPFLWKE
jgi:heme exporter protein B